MTIFGNIMSRKDLEAAAKSTISVWIDTYLCEVERQKGVEQRFYQRPRSISTTNDFTRWDETQLPAIIIISPGLNDRPRKNGDGTFNTWWALGVAVVVSGATEQGVRDMASDYTAALRTLLTQRSSLDGFCNGVEYVDESYDDIPSEDRRSLASGHVIFQVEVDNVAQANAGPITPSEPPVDPTVPIPDWPIAESGSITVVKEETP